MIKLAVGFILGIIAMKKAGDKINSTINLWIPKKNK
jgi:hypothetical protein